MGIAAYNRGSKAIRNQIDRESKRGAKRAAPPSQSIFQNCHNLKSFQTIRRELIEYFAEEFKGGKPVVTKELQERVTRQILFLHPGLTEKEIA